VDGDGKVRLILCHDDPGFHNWVDTQHFERGNLTYRSLLSSSPSTFATRLVKRPLLAQALPADSATVTREQRVAALHERFHAIRQRYGLMT
jgi:hypothetical protein